MHRISVIIPVYNVEKYLARCIDSVLAQTFADFECILIDDGSPDNSPAICDEYAKKDDRIKVIHQKNGGVSSARNAGLDIAQGEWVTFIDSDDWIKENMLEILYNNAINNDCKISFCGYERVLEDRKVFLEPKTKTVKQFCTLTARINMWNNKYYCANTMWGGVILRECIETRKIRFNTDVKCGQDLLFVFFCYGETDKLIYDSTPLYNYFVGNPTATTSLDNEKNIENNMAFFIAEEIMLTVEKNKEFQRELKKHSASTAITLCKRILALPKFNTENYAFYRKRLLKDIFWYITSKDVGWRKKFSAVLYLFPKFYSAIKL